jgi:hypothetical protein
MWVVAGQTPGVHVAALRFPASPPSATVVSNHSYVTTMNIVNNMPTDSVINSRQCYIIQKHELMKISSGTFTYGTKAIRELDCKRSNRGETSKRIWRRC